MNRFFTLAVGSFRDATVLYRSRSVYALDCNFFLCSLSAEGLLAHRLCSQSGSSRDSPLVRYVTLTITVYSTTIVVRVGGSRKPLFKFANYLMIGQTRTRPLQFPIRSVRRFPIANAPHLEPDKREVSLSRCHRTSIAQGGSIFSRQRCEHP